MNGCLGGLVMITAGCDVMPPWGCLLAGIAGGVCVDLVEDRFECWKIDDTVSAVAVHGTCGVIGGILAGFAAPGINGFYQLGVITACLLMVFVLMLALFKTLKKWEHLEISEAEEAEGLDWVEHNLQAYIPQLGNWDRASIPHETGDNKD